MSASLRAARAAALFLELIELPAAQRAAPLQALQDSDPELHAELVQLLARFDGDQSLPPLALAGEDRVAVADGSVGERLGPFELLAPLGRGGMGTVWRARRIDGQYQQEVALKRLQLKPSSAAAMQSLHARFLRERQTLAGLKHPHIAGLLDGGVDPQGQPWFALELVSGVPITRYAQEHRLDLPARLALLLQVADAVQFAHQRLVVHRDLKPDNLLVDQAGQVKLLDFGIVKLLDDEAADGNHTATGAHLFTPNYAAPEQVEGGDISVATDVYALGVILFELLVGRRPFQHSGSGLQMAQISAEWRVEAPSRVLARDTADLRHSRALRGDLDTIVLRCLAREPQRRYATVQALTDDLQRYLQRRPIRARPDSRWYRTAKFLGRHPYSSAAAVAGLTLLLVLTAVSVLQAQRAQAQTALAQRFAEQARGERNLAVAESHRLELLQEHYASVLTRALSAGTPIAPDALLEMAGNVDATAAASDPAARRSIELAQAELFVIRNDFTRAIALLESLRDQLAQLPDSERAIYAETLASAYLRVGRLDDTEPVLDLGDAAAARLTSRKDAVQVQMKLARSQWLRQRGELGAAFKLAMAAVAQVRSVDSMSPLRHGQLLINAAQTALAAAEIDTARALAVEGLALWDNAGLQTLVAYRNGLALLANLDLLRGQPRLALASLERLELGEHAGEPIPGAAARRSSQARALSVLARHDEALAMVQTAQQQFCSVVGAATPDCQRIHLMVVDIALWAGRNALATQELAAVEQTAGAQPAPGIAPLLAMYRVLLALDRSPSSSAVASVDAALQRIDGQGGLGRRSALRQRIGAAERLLAAGQDALAQTVMQPALEATAASAPAVEGGMEAAFLALWRARLVGRDARAATAAWTALREQLGAEHPSVQRWRPAGQAN